MDKSFENYYLCGDYYWKKVPWIQCPCCKETVAFKPTILDEMGESGTCEWITWILRIPVIIERQKYCSLYCQQLHNRYKKEKKKRGRKSEIRLLSEGFWPYNRVSKRKSEMRITLKEDMARKELPDYEHIRFEDTFTYKFRHGLWRICGNPECPDPPRIVYTERRRWEMIERLEPRNGDDGVTMEKRRQRAVERRKTKYATQEGDRIIHLLDLDYEPELVNMNWKYCSARCRVAHGRARQRARKRAIREERIQAWKEWRTETPFEEWEADIWPEEGKDLAVEEEAIQTPEINEEEEKGEEEGKTVELPQDSAELLEEEEAVITNPDEEDYEEDEEESRTIALPQDSAELLEEEEAVIDEPEEPEEYYDEDDDVNPYYDENDPYSEP